MPSSQHQSSRSRPIGRNLHAVVRSIDEMQVKLRKTPEWLLRHIRRITSNQGELRKTAP